LAQVPIKDDDGDITHTMNMYEKIISMLTTNYENKDGTTPGWVNWISWVFDMSKNLDSVIKKVESGELAEVSDLIFNGDSLVNLEAIAEVPIVSPEEMLI